MSSNVSLRDIYNKLDDLTRYIDLAMSEMRVKAELWNVSGTSLIDMIDNLPF